MPEQTNPNWSVINSALKIAHLGPDLKIQKTVVYKWQIFVCETSITSVTCTHTRMHKYCRTFTYSHAPTLACTTLWPLVRAAE